VHLLCNNSSNVSNVSDVSDAVFRRIVAPNPPKIARVTSPLGDQLTV